MDASISFPIERQPNDVTCGPTCLHAVYNYFGDSIGLHDVIDQVPQLRQGGTLGVQLACHALRRGYRATILTYNLRAFDPTWFGLPSGLLHGKLDAQLEHKDDPRLQFAIKMYMQFLELGGEIGFRDLNGRLLHKYLKKEIPVLTGLSATYLYQNMREYGDCKEDDLRGYPVGHFVVLCGYDRENRKALVADPYLPNPIHQSHYYKVDIDRLICAILLGVLTYDANLIIIEPSSKRKDGYADFDRRQ